MVNMQKLYIEGRNYETAIDSKLLKTCNFVYAHGELQKRAMYDITTCIEEFDYVTDRIEEVIAVLPNGDEIPSRLFFWHSSPDDEADAAYARRNPTYLCHGLVCALSDIEALECAQHAFDEESSFI